MNTRRKVSIAGLVVLGLASYASAQQDVFTFTKDDGPWGVAANWDGPPGRFPGPGEKAIIPASKICRVQAANRAAEIVQVDVGGTLVIDGKTLTLDTDGDGTNDTPKLTVNGQVRFEGTDATLVYGNTGLMSTQFVLDGAGTVLADGAAGHNGIIKNKTGSEHIIEIESPLTLKGSLKILCDNDGTGGEPGARFDGTFLVDDAADTMTIGRTSVARVQGSGAFEAFAGSMILREGFIPKKAFNGSFKVDGSGTMTFRTYFPPILRENRASVDVSGGTLKFERPWESWGGIEFTGGQIIVKPSITATFKLPPI